MVRMFNGWRDQTYQTKREKLTIAHIKRCELEKDQLLKSINNSLILVQEEIICKLSLELENKNRELRSEESRLDELNKKYSVLRQTKENPVSILKRNEPIKKLA